MPSAMHATAVDRHTGPLLVTFVVKLLVFLLLVVSFLYAILILLLVLIVRMNQALIVNSHVAPGVASG